MRTREIEITSREYRQAHRPDCQRCPPHGGENATRYGKHGRTKRRYKDKRGKTKLRRVGT